MFVSEFTALHFTKRIAGEVKELGEQHLPQAQNLALLDMAHGDLRSVAYHAFIVGGSKNETEKKAVQAELDETLKSFGEYYAGADKVIDDPKMQKLLDELKPSLDAYTAAATELAQTALKGDVAGAEAMIPSFQEKYLGLEKSIGALNQFARAQTDAFVGHSAEDSDRAKSTNLWLLGMAVSLGLVLAIWISRDLVGTLSRIMMSLGRESGEVRQTSDSLKEASSALSDASRSQSAALQETAASVEEITAMVRKTSESSRKLESAAQSSAQSANRGQDSVRQMLESMTHISEGNTEILQQVEASNTQISEIVKVIGEIGQKTKVINDIVFQTKLLSFNASVEAARAGEHGKGFAVVAEEVGNLAQMSGNAAKEISDMLQSSIAKVDAIVADTKNRVEKLIVDGRSRVESGVTVAKQCGTSLDEIVRQVGDVNLMISEITTAIHEQTQGINEISKAMNQLDQVTQKNAATAQQTATNSSQLVNQAQALGMIVGDLARMAGQPQDGDASEVVVSTIVTELKPKAKAKKTEKVETPSSGESSAKVVRLKPKTAPQTMASVTKKAVGADDLPSADDPRFRDI